MSNYPDPPGVRMGYDRDGSVGAFINASNIITVLSNAQMQALNNEADDGYAAQGALHRFAIIFPEPRDLQGYFCSAQGSSVWSISIDTSVDSTTGLDGTWVPVTPAQEAHNLSLKPYYRMLPYLAAKSVPGIKAFRLTINVSGGLTGCTGLHLYGKRSTQSANALVPWHPTLDQPISDFPGWWEWGDLARGGPSTTKTFRIKNTSASLTAQSVTLTMSALTDSTAPSLVSCYDMSTPSIGYTPSLPLGSLGPGSISSVVTLRQTLPVGTALGLWSQRLLATPTGWV